MIGSQKITRRQLLKSAGRLGTALVLAGPLGGIRRSYAQSVRLTALGHAVHQAVLTGTAGGAGINILEPTLVDVPVESVEWITLGVDQIHERLFREANLPRTEIDFAFAIDQYATVRNTNVMEPLDHWLEQEPIEDFYDFFPAMAAAWQVEGSTFAIPFRANAYLLHYNRHIFEERGVNGPPNTVEELFEIARQCTFRRPTGEPVYGFGVNGRIGEIDQYVLHLARAWDGDFITQNMEITINEPPVIQAVELVKDMYEAGVIPPNFTQLGANDYIQMGQNGTLVMNINPSTRHTIFNDPETSHTGGQWWFSVPPIAEALRDRYDHSPGRQDLWSIVMPRNSIRKEETWALIREISSPDNHLQMGMSGNGSPRASTYASAEYQAQVPYAAEEGIALRYARPNWPAFDGLRESVDILGNELQRAILGHKPVRRALDDATGAIERLVRRARG